MAWEFLCRLGLHKWSKEKYWTNVSSNVRDFKKQCLRCGIVKTRTETKE
ncbi:MAG: hypothetical protein AABW46_03985 [Nanoarchaeota archaeon]